MQQYFLKTTRVIHVISVALTLPHATSLPLGAFIQ